MASATTQDSGELSMAEVYVQAAKELRDHGGDIGWCKICGVPSPCDVAGTALMLLRRVHVPRPRHPSE